MSSDEARVIQVIVSGSGVHRGDSLLRGLDIALVSNSTPWILDVKTFDASGGADLPDGPFPARAFVPSSAAYRGEIIIWLTTGQVSGLEYAWTTDEPPTAWPGRDEIEVVPLTGF